jgi:hypothetical protein
MQLLLLQLLLLQLLLLHIAATHVSLGLSSMPARQCAKRLLHDMALCSCRSWLSILVAAWLVSACLLTCCVNSSFTQHVTAHRVVQAVPESADALLQLAKQHGLVVASAVVSSSCALRSQLIRAVHHLAGRAKSAWLADRAALQSWAFGHCVAASCCCLCCYSLLFSRLPCWRLPSANCCSYRL